MSTSDAWLTAQQQQVWRQWLSVNARLEAALHRDLQADAGLSLSDFAVLVQLTDAEAGRVRVTDLAQSLQWEKSRVSHHVTRMERRGLLCRQQCPADARGAFVAVTPAGRASIERAAPGHVRKVRELVFDQLAEEEVRVLGAITAKVLAQIDAAAGGAVTRDASAGRTV